MTKHMTREGGKTPIAAGWQPEAPAGDESMSIS